MRNNNPTTFFYFQRLSNKDKTLIGLYSFFTIVLIFVAILDIPELTSQALFFYVLIAQFGFVFELYVSLRNFKSYLIWVGYGALHIMIYLFLNIWKQKGIYCPIALNTVVMLLLFQCFRWISLKTQRRDFVNPAKAFDGRDLIENRKVSITDYVISILYFIALGVLSALSIIFL